jgi:regulator of protease activity HflC (stomatin/prohibitin superfamily)
LFTFFFFENFFFLSCLLLFLLVPETWHFAVGGTCLCIVLIISIVLIAVSFSTLEPNEVGLDVNANTMYLDKGSSPTLFHALFSPRNAQKNPTFFFFFFFFFQTETLWKNGRHFLGLGHYFIVFPTEVRETEVDVVARSIDGASVSMKCSFQWQIEPDVVKVVGLYTLFEEKYAAAFDKIANDEIRNVAAQYTAFDFFFKRTEITLAMSTALDTTLSLVGITVSGFQLLNFDVPPAFSATVQLTEETKQRKTRAESNQQKANITAQAKIETAKEDATVLRVQAEATAVAFVQEKSAQRDSVAIRLTAERESYKNMKQNLTLTTADLLTIIWLTAVQASPAPQLLNVDVPKGVQVESIASPTPAPTTALTESPATVSPTTDAATTAPATTPVAAPTTTGAATTRTSAPATTTL